MAEEQKDFTSYFNNHDIIAFDTFWKQEGRDYGILFLPLEPNNKHQNCLEKTNNEIHSIKFNLLEVANKLYFHDITTNQKYHFDLSELHLSKFHLLGENLKATFLRKEIDYSTLGLTD